MKKFKPEPGQNDTILFRKEYDKRCINQKIPKDVKECEIRHR